MGIIYSKQRRFPEGIVSHLMIYGSVGTGPSNWTHAGYSGIHWFNAHRCISSNGTPDLRKNCLNVVAKENYAWAILNSYSSSDTYKRTNFFVNTNYTPQFEIRWPSDHVNIPNYYSNGSINPFEFSPNYSSLTINYNNYRENINTNIMAAGSDHFLAFSGLTLFAWGNNNFGQCNVPSNVHANVSKITAGKEFSIALLNDGSLTGWGRNDDNQLNIPNGLTAIAIESGLNHTLALKNDGTVICWGNNTYNQCSIPAGLTGVTAIGSGLYHSMAIRTNGTVVCWGLNTSGQCDVPAGITNAMQIAGGSGHTVLLKSDGSVIGWGNNDFKQALGPLSPDPALNGHPSDDPYSPYQYKVNLPNYTKKVVCSANATYVLHNGQTDVGSQIWVGDLATGITGYTTRLKCFTSLGLTTAAAPSGLCFYVSYEGYSPERHDLFTYQQQPTLTNNSVMPTGYNTAWWVNGNSAQRKLDKCFISGYDREGFLKVYEPSFSPPDLSGCSIRPRQLGAPWIGGYLSQDYIDRNELTYQEGYVYKYHPYLWQIVNCGFWCNILISKKHAIASKHFAGPNSNLYNVQWMKRNGQLITRNLRKVSDLNFTYSNGSYLSPDMILYELDEALTGDDLKNISIYNVLPKLSGFTGAKTIDTVTYLWKGYTGPREQIPYDDSIFMSNVGRRLWYLDGNSKIYSKVVSGIYARNSYYIPYTFKIMSPSSSKFNPDDVECAVRVGDSGTPVFITAGNRTNSTEPREQVHFPDQGTTWGRTFFLGLFDAGFGEFGDEFVAHINNIMIASGLTGSELLQKIDIDSVGPPAIWSAPVGSPQLGEDNFSAMTGSGGYFLDQDLITDYLVAEATVESWDPNNKVLEISGISGSFDTSTLGNSYSIENGNCAGVFYTSINQYIIPINNGIGTTAGISNEIDEEAELFNVDINKPC